MSDRYRSLDLAYQFVLPSYDWAARRSDAVESRIQGMLALVTSVTVAVLTIVRVAAAIPLDFDSWWLRCAGLAFALAVVCGLLGRTVGNLKVVHPTILYAEWLDKPPQSFQTEAIYYAGINLNANKKLIDLRHRFFNLMIGLFAVEVICIAGWLYASPVAGV